MRVRFVDSNDAHGEVELAKVQPGDTVRARKPLLSELITVRAGEEGTVEHVDTNRGRLRVAMFGLHRSPGHERTMNTSLEVGPDDIELVLDSRDPRAAHPGSDPRHSTARAPSTARTRAALAPAFHETACILVAEFALRGARESAARWASAYAPEPRTRTRTAAHLSLWLPLILWSVKAYGANFPGKSQPSLLARRHVIWALQQNAEDLAHTIPAHALDQNDEDEQNQVLVAELTHLAAHLQSLSDEEWAETLPALARAMNDPSLLAEYHSLSGLSSPSEDAGLGKPRLSPVDEPAVPAATAPTAPAFTAPTRPAVPARAPFRAPARVSGDEVLEAPGQPQEGPARVRGYDIPPPAIGRSRHDVLLGARENPPHAWAQP